MLWDDYDEEIREDHTFCNTCEVDINGLSTDQHAEATGCGCWGTHDEWVTIPTGRHITEWLCSDPSCEATSEEVTYK